MYCGNICNSFGYNGPSLYNSAANCGVILGKKQEIYAAILQPSFLWLILQVVNAVWDTHFITYFCVHIVDLQSNVKKWRTLLSAKMKRAGKKTLWRIEDKRWNTRESMECAFLPGLQFFSDQCAFRVQMLDFESLISIEKKSILNSKKSLDLVHVTLFL